MKFALLTINNYVFPAYAGVNPIIRDRTDVKICIPRVCGGEP